MTAIRDLGPLLVDGVALEDRLKSPIQRLILTALVARWPNTVPTDMLFELVWPNRPFDKSLLWTHIYRLRQVIPKLGLEVARLSDGYALVTPISLDSTEFVQLISKSRDQQPDAIEVVEHIDRALALWRDHPYGALDLEVLVPGYVTELEELRARAISDRATARLELGDSVQAVDEITAFLHDCPFDEGAVEALAVGYCQLGRRTDALRVLNEFRSNMIEELGLEPGEQISVLERSILSGESVGPSNLQHWRFQGERGPGGGLSRPELAAQNTTLIGRSHVQEQLLQALKASPLVTLTGIGGIGKTSLARETARGAVGSWPDGVSIVEIDKVGEQQSLSKAFADAIDMPLAGEASSEQIADEVAERLADLNGLLIVDNCEAMVDAVAEFLDQVLVKQGSVRVLSTSRERLNLRDEHVIVVPPLDANDAIELVMTRASAVNSQLVLDPDSETLLAIVEMLDGLPLALELAAAQLVYLGPEELLRLIGERFEILKSHTRGSQRHPSLVGVLESSWDLLDDDERSLLASVSTFGGTFSIDVAAVVFESSVANTLNLLRALHQKSLVKLAHRDRGVRYELLETVRLFAAQKLAELPSPHGPTERHLDWLINFGVELTVGIHTEEETDWIKNVDLELPNIVATAERARQQGLTDKLLDLYLVLEPEFFLRMRPELGPVLRRHAEQLDAAGDPRLGLAVASMFRLGFANGQRVAELTEWYQEVDWHETVTQSPTARLCVAAMERAAGNYVEAVEWLLPLPDELAALGQAGEAARVRATIALYRAAIDRDLAEVEAKEAVEACQRSAGAGSTAIALAWASAVFEDVDDQLDYARRAVQLADESGTVLAESSALTRVAYCKAIDARVSDQEALEAIRCALDFHVGILSADRQWSTVLMSLVGLVERGWFGGVAEAWAAVTAHGPTGLATTETLARFEAAERILRDHLGESEFVRRTIPDRLVSPRRVVAGLLAAVDGQLVRASDSLAAATDIE